MAAFISLGGHGLPRWSEVGRVKLPPEFLRIPGDWRDAEISGWIRKIRSGRAAWLGRGLMDGELIDLYLVESCDSWRAWIVAVDRRGELRAAKPRDYHGVLVEVV